MLNQAQNSKLKMFESFVRFGGFVICYLDLICYLSFVICDSTLYILTLPLPLPSLSLQLIARIWL